MLPTKKNVGTYFKRCNYFRKKVHFQVKKAFGKLSV